MVPCADTWGAGWKEGHEETPLGHFINTSHRGGHIWTSILRHLWVLSRSCRTRPDQLQVNGVSPANVSPLILCPTAASSY